MDSFQGVRENTMKRSLVLLLILSLVIGGCAAKNDPSSGSMLKNPPQTIVPQTDVIEPLSDNAVYGAVAPLTIVSITSPTLPGNNVTVVAKTIPNAECILNIANWIVSINGSSQPTYPINRAQPWFESDNNGNVSFTFNVDYSTQPGYYRVELTVIKSSLQSTVLTSFLVY